MFNYYEVTEREDCITQKEYDDILSDYNFIQKFVDFEKIAYWNVSFTRSFMNVCIKVEGGYKFLKLRRNSKENSTNKDSETFYARTRGGNTIIFNPNVESTVIRCKDMDVDKEIFFTTEFIKDIGLYYFCEKASYTEDNRITTLSEEIWKRVNQINEKFDWFATTIYSVNYYKDKIIEVEEFDRKEYYKEVYDLIDLVLKEENVYE